MKSYLKFLLLCGLFIFLTGCFQKPKSEGGDTNLFIIAEESDWKVLEPTLREAFEKTIITPQPEKVFVLHWIPPEKFNEVAKRKNLIILGTFETRGELKSKIEKMLSPEVRAKVAAEEEYVFTKKDPWAKNQLLMVLVGNNLDELKQKIAENKEFLYDLFKKKLIKDTAEEMFAKYEQKNLEKELLRKYGWTLRIQHDYFLNIERPQNHFIMLRRTLPGRERWLFVHWIDNADSSIINHEWLIKKRNQLTKKFYQNDRINERFTKSRRIKFLGRDAWVLEGLWENDEKVAGGPFKMYAFYDMATERIYLIDIAVYFPAGEKEPFLRQLDIMAHTFRTNQEITEKDIEEWS